MAAALSRTVRVEDVLRVIIDYGTGFIKVAAQHALAGQLIDGGLIQIIPLKPGYKEVEQKIIIDGEQLLYGSSEIRKWVAEHLDETHMIIESVKLCLCTGYKDSPVTKRVYAALNAKEGDLAAIQLFLTRHFRSILGKVKNHYSTNHPTGMRHQRDYWDCIRIESMITVPANCSTEACGIWRNAAHNAGMPNIDIRLEPLCAAASDMRQLCETGIIDYGSQMCFADIGKGTFDLATARIGHGASDNSHPEIHTVGKVDGADLGAQRLNDEARKWLLEEWVVSHPIYRTTGVRGICRLLGNLSHDEFHRRFSDGFEIAKKEFAGDADDSIYSITIQARRGWQQVPKSQPNLVIDMPQSALEAIYTTWTLKLAERLLIYLSADDQAATRTVMLTGASRQNSFVQAQLKQHLASIGRQLFVSHTEHPITTGGLRQYPRHVSATLPHGVWNLVRDEGYVRHTHRDAYKTVPVRREYTDAKSGKVKNKTVHEATPILSKVRKNPVTGEPEVTDRLAWFMTRLPDQVLKTRCLPLEFQVDADAPPRLLFDIYYSPNKHHEHDPLRDDYGEVKNDFSKYPMLFADTGDLLDHGFKEQPGYTHEDSAYHVVTGLLFMNATEKNITVTIKLLCPDEKVRYKKTAAGTNTNEVDKSAPYRVFYEKTQELWDTDRPHTAIDLVNQRLPSTSSLVNMATAAQNMLSSYENSATGQCPQTSPSQNRALASSRYGAYPPQKRNRRNEDCFDEDDEEPGLQQGPSKRFNPGWSAVNGPGAKQPTAMSTAFAMAASRTRPAPNDAWGGMATGSANRPQRAQPKPGGFYDLNA